MHTHATINELLEPMFSMKSVLRLYNEDQPPKNRWKKIVGWKNIVMGRMGPGMKNECAGEK
jgi:hypothetical protein